MLLLCLMVGTATAMDCRADQARPAKFSDPCSSPAVLQRKEELLQLTADLVALGVVPEAPDRARPTKASDLKKAPLLENEKDFRRVYEAFHDFVMPDNDSEKRGENQTLFDAMPEPYKEFFMEVHDALTTAFHTGPQTMDEDYEMESDAGSEASYCDDEVVIPVTSKILPAVTQAEKKQSRIQTEISQLVDGFKTHDRYAFERATHVIPPELLAAQPPYTDEELQLLAELPQYGDIFYLNDHDGTRRYYGMNETQKMEADMAFQRIAAEGNDISSAAGVIGIMSKNVSDRAEVTRLEDVSEEALRGLRYEEAQFRLDTRRMTEESMETFARDEKHQTQVRNKAITDIGKLRKSRFDEGKNLERLTAETTGFMHNLAQRQEAAADHIARLHKEAADRAAAAGNRLGGAASSAPLNQDAMRAARLARLNGSGGY